MPDVNSMTFIDHLQEIRSNLRDSLRTAESFHAKLVGPSPAEEQASKEACESVASILAQISLLSVRLTKAVSHQHTILGDFAPAQPGNPAQATRYA